MPTIHGLPAAAVYGGPMENDHLQWAAAMRDMAAQVHLRPILGEAEVLLGERLTDSYFDGPNAVHLSVLDLQDNDAAVILAAARRLGIDESAVRIERSDPAALEAWHRLRHELDELHRVRPRVLHSSPSTDQRFCHPPFCITLMADAESTAEHLHRSYGRFVVLSVGALPYPPTVRAGRPQQDRDHATSADPHELWAELDGPLTIARGQTAVHHVNITNRSDRKLEVHTNGHLTASVINPVTDEAVGGYTGMQNLPLVTFTAAPTGTVRIPLLVGTASFLPELGYTVPPGMWGLIASIHLGDGRLVAVGPMKFAIS